MTVIGQARQAEKVPVVSTGPSGLVLGTGLGGPITLRLFSPQPTRIYLAAPDYVKWLLVFRSVALGAHVTILTNEARSWLTLADAVRECGGTIDVLRETENLPGQGRPYRPSLIVDENAGVSAQTRLGAWQSVLSVGEPGVTKAVNDMRNCDVALVAPVEGKAAENVRRAYALSLGQIKQAAELDATEVALASVRRLIKVPIPPSPTEYRLLFGN